MDYSAILSALNDATPFELFRLNSAIWRELNDPKKLEAIRRRLRQGQRVTYFEPTENRLIEAEVLKVNKTRVLVRNLDDRKDWNLPFYYVNVDALATDITSSARRRLDRTQVKVGDKVAFVDRDGVEQFGEVIKLNPKTAGVLVGATRWKVGYELLSSVLDGELQNEAALIEGTFVR